MFTDTLHFVIGVGGDRCGVGGVGGCGGVCVFIYASLLLILLV